MCEPLQGHSEQSYGSVLIFLVKKDVPKELQSFMDLKSLSMFEGMYQEYCCPLAHQIIDTPLAAIAQPFETERFNFSIQVQSEETLLKQHLCCT
jgi:hypothetical protein